MVSLLVSGFVAIALLAQTDCSVLYFQSSQCEPCRSLEPALIQMQQLGWNVRKIDAPNQLEISRQFQIKNLPTLVVMCGNQEVDRMVGAIAPEQLRSRLDRVAARARSTVSVAPNLAPNTSTAQSGQALATHSPIAVAQPAGDPTLLVRGQSPSSSESTDNSIAAPSNGLMTLDANPSHSKPNPGPGQAFPLLASAAKYDSLTSSSNPDKHIVHGSHPAPSAASKVSIESAISRAANATVRIRVEESNTLAHGTGTIVAVHGSEALVLTCGHLFRDMLPGSTLTVDLFAGTPRQTNVVARLIDYQAQGEDIALLSIQLPVAIEPVPILPVSEAVQKGQPVFSFGCDHGKDPTRRDTRVTHINRYLGAANIEIAGAPAVGRSGGGLFDQQGRLIGVCNAACNEDDEGIYAAGDVIYKQLARADQSHLFQSTTSAAASPKPNVVAVSTPMNSSQNLELPSPASSTTPASPQATGSEWPDQDPRLAVASTAPKATTEQLICVIREAGGKERVVTIQHPPNALLQAIQQQAGLQH